VSLLDDIVSRSVLVAADGKSGTPLERVVLSDGRALVVKKVVPAGDWLMRATGDTGRINLLWEAGIFDRLPGVVDPAILEVVTDESGWMVVMPDVSEVLLPESGTISRATSRRILSAAAALHQTFTGLALDGLCPIPARYTFLSPATAARERAAGEPVPKLIGTGWERFADMAPPDIWDAVQAVHNDPAPFVREVARAPATLIHGDLKFGNVGLGDNRVILIDWGDRAGIAPPMVELAWYLAINATRIAATKDEIIDDYMSSYPEDPDRGALPLGLLGGLVQLGWNKALLATGADRDVAERERADLEWWVARAREGLELWSPN
jgi:hypothetical protein